MRKVFAIVITLALALGAQTALTTLFFYSGTDLEYTCEAPAIQPAFYWSRNNSTLTNIVDSSNTGTATTSTAHGLQIGNKVTVSGGTVDTDINGTFIILTVPSTTTFTYASASVSDATYTESTLRIMTTAPRDTAGIWKVKKFRTVSALLQSVQTAVGGRPYGQVCADRATLDYQ